MSWTCRICGATGNGTERMWQAHYAAKHYEKGS